jgi:di/tricarboxylate transporter
VLGIPKSVLGAQARLMLPLAAMSAFMNNTPLVAMMLPVVDDWTRKARLSASKLMIPLSYATILGGTCTLIGTSTNLVVHGLLVGSGQSGLSMFELAPVGVVVALTGIAFVLLTSRWLLPDRRPPLSVRDDAREYTVEMIVEPGSPLVGRSIEGAGLRHLPGLYLMEIERAGEAIPAVAPETRLHAADRLVFAGVVDSVVDLQRIRGLRPATDQVFKLDAPRLGRTLIEAVVSPYSPLVGLSIREGEFRTVYHAVVIAVARAGERLRRKIGDIVLRPGDTLLLEAPSAFVAAHRDSRDFYLVSSVEGARPPRHERAWLAIGILFLMVGAVSLELVSMLNAAMLGCGALIATRCISWGVARRAVDPQVLLVIAAALGIGAGLEVTGAARALADALLGFAGEDPWRALFVIYGVTMLFTELITNNAAAALVFPIALATAERLGVDFRPFAIAITFAASASFATPIGYQTNLMVMNPGAYRFADYLRVGVPLNLAMWLLTTLLVPRWWPF